MRALVLAIAITGLAAAQKFYPDDPLRREPKPLSIEKVLSRKVEDYFDFFHNTFAPPGDRNRIPAQGVNTLGEPMDGAWYTHRHYFRRMSPDELALGPGGKTPPAAGPWTVIRAKGEGITPGFTILDREGRRYFLKFDPPDNMEMATAADVISSRFFHALGYHVADQYLVYFDASRLVLGKDVKIADELGRRRPMTSRDLTEILLKTRPYRDGKYRAVASLQIPGEGRGPFRFFGQRKDDPNDVVPHEHRRDLRGLYVFCAWLNHEDSRAINTFDSLVEEGGAQYLRHYLLDFGSTLGSASTKPNPARSSHEPLFSWRHAAVNILSLGLYLPHWTRVHYPDYPAVGRFEASAFDPDRWYPEYRNAAFDNRLPDDDFWAAKQVLAFTDEDVRAIVRTGEYGDREVEDYMVRTLAARRDRIGKTFLPRVLPLDRFEVRGAKLVFEELAPAGELRVAWSAFDNGSGQKSAIEGANTFELPRSGAEYLVADISRIGDDKRTLSVYVRKSEVVGIERRW
jgi:hypothetical protein